MQQVERDGEARDEGRREPAIGGGQQAEDGE